MNSCLKWSVVLGGFVAVVGYLLWAGPLPEDIDEPVLIHIAAAGRKLYSLFRAGWLAQRLFGYSNHFQPIRKIFDGLASNPTLDSDPDLEVKDLVFNGVPVRMYRPEGAPKPSPAFLHFHGGGWSLGSVRMADNMCRYIAKKAKTVVISVEYRLGPEHPFPASLDDCVTATVYALINHRELGINVHRIGVGGRMCWFSITCTQHKPFHN